MSTRSVMPSQAVAGRLGLSPTDLETLEILEANGPLTGVVDRLEEGGFVRRERDAGDRARQVRGSC